MWKLSDVFIDIDFKAIDCKASNSRMILEMLLDVTAMVFFGIQNSIAEDIQMARRNIIVEFNE